MASNTATSTGTGVQSDDEIEGRTRRARSNDIRVVGVRENADSYTLNIYNRDGKGEEPSRYDVHVSKAAPVATGCSCKDEVYNSPDGGCKHRRFVTEILSVVESLEADEYVSEEQIRAMVDAHPETVTKALFVVEDE